MGPRVTVPGEEGDSETTDAALIVVALSTEVKAGLKTVFWDAGGIAWPLFLSCAFCAEKELASGAGDGMP